MSVVENLLAARAAYERREWVTAYEALSDQDALDVGDFVRLGTAAFLAGCRNDAVQALQRAYRLHLDGGDPLAAAHCAFWLAMILITGGETAVGGGWVARARRLVDDEVPGDTVEHGYVLVADMYGHIAAGDFRAVAQCAREITEHGHRFGDPDLLAMGLASWGRLSLYQGRVREGLAMMDEAMVGVAAGDVSPIFAGHVYCLMIEACQEVADFGRAVEWTEALTTWCADQPGLIPFTGQCAVHRGQIMRIRGAYDEALEEFAFAVRRYVSEGSPAAAGLALAERGDVMRLRGRYDEADDAYRRAAEFGHEPQPGLALLWLARGRTAAALGAARRLLAEPRDPVHRCQVLPAAIEILSAAGRTEEAADLSVELTDTASEFGVAAVRAMAAYAAGSVALGRGDGAAAIRYLRASAREWNDLDSPYESARCAVAIGRALRALGDEESAATEIDTARCTFDQVGAVPAARAAAALLAPSEPGGLTAREVEVLRLVATGKTNREIAETLFLSEKTVARHLSNIFDKIDVTSRTAAAAFAFEKRLA
ncbi:LuxR C-terminal-related transcriptional regulator (plasmid) [Rhodococcus opacus]|uniref:LuxR C-terminal-related transcriptional regulator n=1 Tax=Rhodococcus opacus TaxID=37919 RepID=UPI0034D28982